MQHFIVMYQLVCLVQSINFYHFIYGSCLC